MAKNKKSESKKVEKEKTSYAENFAVSGLLVGSLISLYKGLNSTDSISAMMFIPIGFVVGALLGEIIDSFKKEENKKTKAKKKDK